jgi:sec-independent protein translocase protein TatB
MEILGIGAPELVFIVIIALIVLGPKDMQKAGRTIGRWLNSLVSSDGWRAFQRTSREIRNLPTNLMRQANLEDLRETGQDLQNAIDPNWNRKPPVPGVPEKPKTAPRPEPPGTQREASRSILQGAENPPAAPPVADSPESDSANPPDEPERDA